MKFRTGIFLLLLLFLNPAAKGQIPFFRQTPDGACVSAVILPERFEKLPGIEACAKALLPVDPAALRKNLHSRGIRLDVTAVLVYAAGDRRFVAADGLTLPQLTFLIRKGIIAPDWSAEEVKEGLIRIRTGSKGLPPVFYAAATEKGVMLFEDPRLPDRKDFPPERGELSGREPAAVRLFLRPGKDAPPHPALKDVTALSFRAWRGEGADGKPRLKAEVLLEGPPGLYDSLKLYFDTILRNAAQFGEIRPEHREMFRVERAERNRTVIRISLTEETAAAFLMLFSGNFAGQG